MLPLSFFFPGLPLTRQYGVQRQSSRGTSQRGAERCALLGPDVGHQSLNPGDASYRKAPTAEF